jgi:hypothetical protein
VSAGAPEPQREPAGAGRPSTGPFTFYPGASSPEAAQPVTVGLGEEIAGLSFAMVPFKLAAIAGAVRLPDGRPVSDVALVLMRRALPGGGSSSGTRPVRPDGSFLYPNLPPGEYTLMAVTRSDEQTAIARVALDGTDVNLVLTPGRTDVASGRIAFEGRAAPESLQPSQVRVRPVSLDPSGLPLAVGQAVTREDWTFRVPVSPGAYLLRATLPAGWAIKSIRAGTTDVTDTPLLFNGSDIDNIEILLTDRLTEVSGAVLDGLGQPIADGAVVLLADDPARWGPETRFVAIVRPDARGRFQHRGLPAARYVAVAVDYLEPGEETNPETLAELQRLGVGFTLDAGESKSLDVTLTSLP